MSELKKTIETPEREGDCSPANCSRWRVSELISALESIQKEFGDCSAEFLLGEDDLSLGKIHEGYNNGKTGEETVCEFRFEENTPDRPA